MEEQFDPTAIAAEIRNVVAAMEADSQSDLRENWRRLQNLTGYDRVTRWPNLSEEAEGRLQELLAWGTRTGSGPLRFLLERRPGLGLLRAALEAVDDPWHGPDWEVLASQQ
jgi:hypothetical protein